MSQVAEHRLLQVDLCESDIKNICGRYHFEDIDLPLLQEVYGSYLKGCMISAYFTWLEEDRIAAVLTLGKEIDEVQGGLMEGGKLSEAYMLECLSSELLMKAYEKADDFLQDRTKLWCGMYEFPGSDCPIEELGNLLLASGQKEVTCNEAYALIPQKSVAYFVRMQREKSKMKREQSLCANCKNYSCNNRREEEKEKAVPYGYMRIFGKGGKNK
ncbi:hypothetical protein [Kineothrix sp. MB12-C1]|uniref:hypothetical protein n=1 Tax=Kineothrix sp. MB12-C1 TaxID=3070215 RepID=UPI0027D2D496|nr:hypothetical protein [Kineothrix sp. MB12-C1]WMC93536.1 hypothetical protein RBB56_04430 [Kineothrix sp. MB12-C1]